MTAPSRARRGHRIDVDDLVATGAVILLTVVTAIAMCRVFADWHFLRTLVAIALGVHLSALLLRVLRVPGFIAVPVTVLVVIELLALLFYRDTMQLLLPSSDTLQLLRLDLRLVWSQFPTAVAPVPSEGSFLLAAALGIGIVAVLADAFAFRAYGRAEAVVPSGVLFVFTAALGTDRNRITVAAAWFAAALVVVAVLRALHGGSDESWLGRRRRAVGAALPATAMCAAVAALGAAVIGPLLPGAGAEPLLETRQSQSDVTEVLSPLVDIRSRLVNRKNVEMFTVTSPVGRYWRVSGLSEFDGSTWGLPDRELLSTDGLLNTTRSDSLIVQQQFHITRFGGKLVPAAFAPITVAQDELLWLPGTDTLVVQDGLREGAVYDIASDVAVPPPDVLRATTASAPPSDEFLALPDDLPDEIRSLAAEITAGAATPYDQAVALQNWFRSEFAYDLTVQRGHGDDAILSFLRIRRGYCEQFAGTFGVMARAIGLPARVAVGFTQGELQADGQFHVYGRHAHAWPEVWFDGVGWVLFEPTPGRGAPGSEATTGQSAAQDATAAQPGTGEPVAAPSTTGVQAVPTTEPNIDNRPATATTAVPLLTGPRSQAGGGGVVAWVLLGLALLVAWIVAMPVLVRRFTRLGATPTERVISAWHGTVGSLQLAGAPPPAGATPIEYARLVERELAVDHRSLLELARFATRAVYSPAGVGEPAAMRAAVLHTHLDRSSRDLMPWYTRLISRADPRLVRQRLLGNG